MDGMIGERKVKFFTKRATFDRAEAMCINLGMQLLVIKNEDENQEACLAIKDEPDVWIGGRNAMGGPFYWTGPWEQISFSKGPFKKGEPFKRGLQDSFCLLLWPCGAGALNKGWWPWQCDAFAPYICQETEEEWIKRTKGTTVKTTTTNATVTRETKETKETTETKETKATKETTTMSTTVVYLEEDDENSEAWLHGLLWFFMVGMLVTGLVVVGVHVGRNKRRTPVIVNKMETTVRNVFYEQNLDGQDHYSVI